MNKDQKIIFFIIVFPLTLYFSLRSLHYLTNLFEAQKIVSDTRRSITDLKDKNRLLRDSLSFIQSPEFLDQEAHEKFGLGGKNDVLLKLPPFSPRGKFDYFYPPGENTPLPSNLSLWLKHFVY